MSTFNFPGLPPEIQIDIYIQIFLTHFARLDSRQPNTTPVEPAILRTNHQYRQEGLQEYRAFLHARQEHLEYMMPHEQQLAQIFAQVWGPAATGRMSFAASWSMIRIELERLRYYESGCVPLRGTKGHG